MTQFAGQRIAGGGQVNLIGRARIQRVEADVLPDGVNDLP